MVCAHARDVVGVAGVDLWGLRLPSGHRQCDQSKFNRPFTEATACDWLLLFTSGPLDWDGGSCQVPPNRTSCIAWTGTLVGQGTGSPLFEDGVRLACEASLQSQVNHVSCDTWVE